MRRISILITICATLLTALSARGESAKIKFDNTMHDFALVAEEDGSVSHDFQFTNTGDAALVIFEVTTNCGCTVADYPQAPIAPGAQGKVTITFDPKNNPGEFAKEIIVKSNAKKKRTRLHIKGMVMPRKQ